MTEIGKLFGEDVYVRHNVVVGKETAHIHHQDTVKITTGLSSTVFALIHHAESDGTLVPFPCANNPQEIRPGTRVTVYCPHLEIN